RRLAEAAGPVPVGRTMGRGEIEPPAGLVGIGTVVRGAAQIDDAKIRAARRHSDFSTGFYGVGGLCLHGRVGKIEQGGRIAVIRRRLTEVVKSCPDKFARDRRSFILPGKFSIGRRRPSRGVEVVRTYLK